MSLTRLHGRVAKLEAQRAPGGAPSLAYEPPEPSPEWFAELFRLLLESGHVEAVLSSWGVPEDIIGPMAAAMAEDYPHDLMP
jgi:hypothetical protein